jgi:AraC-like DNA-binding protein
MAVAVTSSIAPRFLIALLEEQGIDGDSWLAEAGLSRADLASPELRTPWPQFAELWRRVAECDADVGLALNRRFPEGQMHLVSHLALRSENVGAALAACSRYISLVNPAERIELEPEGEHVAVVYRCDRSLPEIPWLVEHYFALTRRLLGTALGRELPYLAVQLRAAASADASAYLQAFGVQPEFNAERNAVLLASGTLQWPLPTRDAYLREILERVAARDRPLLAIESWSERSRAWLTRSLLQGDPVSLDATALALGTDANGLRQRLKAEGLTYRDLLDQTRRDLAQEHLRQGMSASEVAYLLGFSEPAALQHACRRWFGVAAGEVAKTRTGTPLPRYFRPDRSGTPRSK